MALRDEAHTRSFLQARKAAEIPHGYSRTQVEFEILIPVRYLFLKSEDNSIEGIDESCYVLLLDNWKLVIVENFIYSK